MADLEPARYKPFPVPDAGPEPMRVHVSAEAYGEIVGHAKASLDAEVCGVLVGRMHEDDDGLWVSVQAAVRGRTAESSGTHVTYTQETWDRIYEIKDRDFPRLDIVGWYHSHPGFGVEFSDMDLFIQENFFAAVGQAALVTDPLGGDEAVCVNTPSGLAHLERIWVDGRERTCRLPRRLGSAGAASAVGIGADEASTGVERRLDAIEQRLGHTIQAIEEHRATSFRFLLVVGMLVAFAAVLWIVTTIWDRTVGAPEPPRRLGIHWLDVPVAAEKPPLRVGVSLYGWEVPPELYDRMLVDLERRLRAQAEALQQEQQEQQEQQAQQEQQETPP